MALQHLSRQTTKDTADLNTHSHKLIETSGVGHANGHHVENGSVDFWYSRHGLYSMNTLGLLHGHT